ncbi:MAG: methyltransferase domain-containing protein [Planctomycetota bacterium]|jgi:SAM-dependent methyltransferase
MTSDIRKHVEKSYAKAIETREGGCCGPSCGDAEYDPEATSFGCGDPLAFAEVRAGQTVLDLGSGAGPDLIAAARRVGPAGRVIGVDMTDEMIAKARENVARLGLVNVEVRKGYIEDLPVEDESIDWVISNCVINLSPDKPAVFREIARVLRRGGRFSISDIVAQDLPEALRESAKAYAACIGGAISEAEYVAGLEAAGLREVGVTGRLVYEAEQLKAIVASDLEAFGVEPGLIEAGVVQAAGKVWSAKFTGRKQDAFPRGSGVGAPTGRQGDAPMGRKYNLQGG